MPLQPNCFVASDSLLASFIADNKSVPIPYSCLLYLLLPALGEEVESSFTLATRRRRSIRNAFFWGGVPIFSGLLSASVNFMYEVLIMRFTNQNKYEHTMN